MDQVERFLAHAIALEREAARRYEELAAAMTTDGNRELAVFFSKMAHYSRLHLAEARERGGFRTLPVMAAGDYEWPDGVAPETADWAGVDAQMDAAAALQLALDCELRGHAYYAMVAGTSRDPEVVRLARDFADEEAQHVLKLRKLMGAHAA